MRSSGVNAAIIELEQDVKRLQHIIGILRGMKASHASQAGSSEFKVNRLSAAGRRRISLAAKKRWAAVRAAKKNS
jgi:hypothetical protein